MTLYVTGHTNCLGVSITSGSLFATAFNTAVAAADDADCLRSRDVEECAALGVERLELDLLTVTAISGASSFSDLQFHEALKEAWVYIVSSDITKCDKCQGVTPRAMGTQLEPKWHSSHQI
jgi:hypothetical protein